MTRLAAHMALIRYLQRHDYDRVELVPGIAPFPVTCTTRRSGLAKLLTCVNRQHGAPRRILDSNSCSPGTFGRVHSCP